MPTALRQKVDVDCTPNPYLYKRVRIFLKEIYRNESMCAGLSKFMNLVEGVQFSKANPITGNILVIFDETIIDESCIGNQIYHYLKSAPATTPTPVPQDAKVIMLDSARSRRETNNKLSRLGTAQKVPYHIMHKNEIEELLNTDAQNGLSEQEVENRLKKHGLNALSEKKRDSIFCKILKNLFDFSTGLLLGVGTVSLFVGEMANAIAIFGIVALETILSTIQQHKAESSISSLKGLLVNKAKVIRDGKEHTILAKHLVPGDVIIVETGEKIPADARLIESYELRTTEASLTGESTAVEKSPAPCRKEAGLPSQHNMLFMGSDVVCGRGLAVVTATGMATEIGKIAAMLQNIQQSVPPIQQRVNRLTRAITIAAGCFCLIFVGTGLFFNMGLGQVIVMAICFSIGAIPESLPAVVSASMAMSVQRMAQKNAIVRSLPAVETLGSTDVICCDKTGTLTMNEMTVKQIYVDRSFYNATGTGYCPDGLITLESGQAASQPALVNLLKAGVLCNNAALKQAKDKWVIDGDPTEGALLTAATKAHLSIAAIKRSSFRIKEIPFDSSRQCMTVLSKTEDGLVAYCKGALGKVMEKCSFIYEDGQERLLTANDKQQLQAVCEKIGDKALRVLSFAYKKANHAEDSLASNFVFLGLAGMADPARPGVKKSIQQCHQAGIKVVMITGDNRNTASEIARQVGLLQPDGMVITGDELEAMTDEALQSKINTIEVFARTCPNQKHRIVKALQKAGHTVAMIGDGVNDTPAMKEADIGVAMGKSGSDVAKDVAEITLVDDNFSTIVAAIQEGRSVSKNIQNSVKYLLAGALGEVAAISLCALGFGVLPLLSIQVLWVNVIAETIIGSSLAAEPPCRDVMNQKPFSKEASLIDKPLMKQIVKNGLMIGLSTLGIFSGAMLAGFSLAKARTLAFVTLIFSQLVYAFRCRSNLKQPPSPYMHAALLSSTLLLAVTIYYPPLSAFFGTVPLTSFNAGAIYAASSINRF